MDRLSRCTGKFADHLAMFLMAVWAVLAQDLPECEEGCGEPTGCDAGARAFVHYDARKPEPRDFIRAAS